MSNVADAAEEFVEKMTDISPEGSAEPEATAEGKGKLTMEERKAKMDELRRKMVRPLCSS